MGVEQTNRRFHIMGIELEHEEIRMRAHSCSSSFRLLWACRHCLLEEAVANRSFCAWMSGLGLVPVPVQRGFERKLNVSLAQNHQYITLYVVDQHWHCTLELWAIFRYQFACRSAAASSTVVPTCGSSAVSLKGRGHSSPFTRSLDIDSSQEKGVFSKDCLQNPPRELGFTAQLTMIRAQSDYNIKRMAETFCVLPKRLFGSSPAFILAAIRKTECFPNNVSDF